MTPPRWWPGDQNISPLFIPRSPEVAGCGGVPGSLTENYKHCVKHKPSAAAQSRSQRRGLYRTLTLCYNSLSSLIITQLTFLWPGRQRGHLPTCFCTCLLLDAQVWCLPSSELSVLSLEAGGDSSDGLSSRSGSAYTGVILSHSSLASGPGLSLCSRPPRLHTPPGSGFTQQLTDGNLTLLLL